MKILYTCVGEIGTNCYLVYDEDSMEGAIIDPGDNAPQLLKLIRDHKINLKYILLTHAHFDHILAVGEIKEETGAEIVVNPEDAFLYEGSAGMDAFGIRGKTGFPGADIPASEGTEVTFGNIIAHYYHTPGHTPGSCTIQIDNVLFTGDTLFRHECGRCDLAGGDFDAMLRSLKRLHDLEGDFLVLPGHMGKSTLQEERNQNMYMIKAVMR